MTWVHAAEVALVAAAIGQTCFVGLYATRPFWRHFVGRALMMKSASLALVLWVSVANIWLTYPYQLQVSACLTMLIAAAIWFQFVALVREVGGDRRHPL